MGLIRKFRGYPRLILAGSPTRLDVGMLLCGTVCAIASGVPFPLIGVIFGQLLNDFNAATCAETEVSGSVSGLQGGINSKILTIFYLAIAQFVLIGAHLFCWSMYGARLAQR